MISNNAKEVSTQQWQVSQNSHSTHLFTSSGGAHAARFDAPFPCCSTEMVPKRPAKIWECISSSNEQFIPFRLDLSSLVLQKRPASISCGTKLFAALCCCWVLSWSNHCYSVNAPKTISRFRFLFFNFENTVLTHNVESTCGTKWGNEIMQMCPDLEIRTSIVSWDAE